MRVRGNIPPEAVTIELYRPTPGHVEIRLRENVKTVNVDDEVNGEEIVMYEYDEYVFHLKNRDGLKEEIEGNLQDWLETGRSLEVNENASNVVTMKERSEKRIRAVSAAGAQEAKALAVATNTAPAAQIGVFSAGVEPWESGKTYQQYDLFTYGDAVGYVKQPSLTAQEIYPPFSVGTEALYGARPAPDEDGVYPYTYNMAASVGMKVREDGVVYECIQAINDMLYPPSQLAAHFVLA